MLRSPDEKKSAQEVDQQLFIILIIFNVYGRSLWDWIDYFNWVLNKVIELESENIMRFFYLLSLIRKNNSSTSVNTELSVDSCKAKHLLTIPKLTIFLQ